MKALRFIIIAFAASAMTFSSLGLGADGLVQVQSVYTDKGTHNNQSIMGTGSLIQVDTVSGIAHYFVLTAAHVGQGEDLTINFGDQKAKILGQLADNTKDIEWIEIENPHRPALEILQAGDTQLLSRSNSDIVHSWSAPNSGVLYFHFGTGSSSPAIPMLLSVTDQTARSIRPEAYNSNDVASETVSDFRHGGLLQNGAGDQLIAPVRIVPGMSGAPVLTNSGIAGVTLAYDRRFEASYFASADNIGKLLERYEAGDRGTEGSARIGYRYGLSYVDYGNGTKEINTEQASAGGGTTHDGGGGSTHDGGGATGLEPSGDVWDQLHISPGVSWKGAPAIAFRIPSLGLVYADRTAIDYIQRTESGSSVSTISPGANLREILLSRYAKDFGGGTVFNFVGKISNPDEIQITSGGLVGNEIGKSTLEFLPGGKIQISIPMNSPNQETLRFQLEENGGLIDPQTGKARAFRPVIRLSGPVSKIGYSIDLRPFFFTDLSYLSQSDVKQAAKFDHPQIRIRQDGQDHEYNLQFRWIEPKIQQPIPCTPSENPNTAASHLVHEVQDALENLPPSEATAIQKN